MPNDRKHSSVDFVVGDFTVFPDRNTVRKGYETVHLEPRVMDLLVYLAERPDEVLSAEEIINDVWPHTSVTDGALLTAVSALRKALGDDARHPAYIETIPKRGYRLIAASSARASVLAVLPIANESGDSGLSFLTDGLTAGLIEGLGAVPALRVISRSSAMRFGSAGRRVREIAGKLGARIVVTGAMSMQEGRTIRVSMRVTDVGRDEPVLARVYSRPETELLELQQHIVQDVASATGDRLRSRPTARAHRADPDAVIEYLRGRFHFYRLSPDHFARALRHFERAIEIDPDYAPAHVGIADIWGGYGYWGTKDPSEIRDRMLMHADKAIKVDPDNPDALVIRASGRMYFDYDWDAAEADLRHAISLNPNLGHARLIHALLLGTLGRPDAIDESERSLRIDPLNPAVILVRGLIHSAFGNHAAAFDDTNELLAIEPSHPPGLQLSADLRWQSADPDAIRYERDAWQHDPEMVATLTNRPDSGEALRRAAGLLLERSRHRYVSAYEIARLLCLGGRIDEALGCVRSAIDSGSLMRVDFLQMSPAFASLRDHASYAGIRARLGIHCV